MKSPAAFVFAALVLAAVPAPAQEAHEGMDHAAMGHGTAAGADSPSSKAYEEAMKTMHAKMAVPPTGDPDRDFLTGMIPHHEGAIAMARIELEHGKDEKAKALARRIVEAQEAEIAEIHALLEAMK